MIVGMTDVQVNVYPNIWPILWPLVPVIIPPSEAVCLSADCVTAAASILGSLDLGVNPCQDFYQAE
jgi:hypothetical protein